MTLAHSTSIVTDGLVFYYDEGNKFKSWKGEPTTNLFGVPTPAANGMVSFPVQNPNNNLYRVYSGNFGGYDISPSDVVYKWTPAQTVNGCNLHGYNGIPTEGATYTYSLDYYVSPSATDYPITNFLGNVELYDYYSANNTFIYRTGLSVTDPNPSIRGVWKRYEASVAVPTMGAGATHPWFNVFLYPGACENSDIANTGFLLYKNPQFELKSSATRYAQGTRNANSVILDMIGGMPLSTNNIVYSSDSFSFNNSQNGVSVSAITGTNSASILFTGNEPYTLESWIYMTANPGVDNYPCLFFRDGGLANRDGYVFYYSSYGASDNITFGFERFTSKANNAADYVEYSTTNSEFLNKWHHMIGTYDGSTLRMYVDNVLVGSNSSTRTITNTVKPVQIGHLDNYYAFGGKMSVAKIYNKALSAAEINQNYNALRGRFGV
jgi:hypothetical protein